MELGEDLMADVVLALKVLDGPTSIPSGACTKAGIQLLQLTVREDEEGSYT